MNEQELFSEIKRLHVEEKIDESVLGADFFLEQPQYEYLNNAFHNTKYRKYKKNGRGINLFVLY